MTSFLDQLSQSKRPLIMGILNLTPDSFSDGRPQASVDDFLRRADELIQEGADVLDLGGESTRPQAPVVDLETEQSRVLPFLKKFRRQYPDFFVSLDTKKPELAREALEWNIDLINDVSFCEQNEMAGVVAQSGVAYCLMHSRGNSVSMDDLTSYPGGVIDGVQAEFDEKLKQIEAAGVKKTQLILDLGFGFAKTQEQCVELIDSLPLWTKQLSYPWLFGVSRKRFVQQYSGVCDPLERDEASAQLAQKAALAGFKILRVHNVKLTKQHLEDL